MTLLCMALATMWAGPSSGLLTLEGHPVHLVWHDLDGDGHKDLIALMVRARAESEIDAFVQDGALMGTYTEHTQTETTMSSFLNHSTGWMPDTKTEFGQRHIIGLHVEEDQVGLLWLWDEDGLHRWQWSTQGWQIETMHPLPGSDAPIELYSPQIPMMVPLEEGMAWLVPDLEGIHCVMDETRFLAYPGQSVDHQGSFQHPYQSFQVRLPTSMSIDGDAIPELVFDSQHPINVVSMPLGTLQTFHREGSLFDLNNDQMADLIQVEELDDDVEGPKDLPKLRSRIRTFLARSPGQFPDEPDVEQEVPGIVFSTSELPFTITEPFFDINHDGLMDLAGIAMKLSVFQMAKVVTLGRMKMTFLLHLSLQQQDGRFTTLRGCPHKITWKINLRRLKMPDFGQLTADLDGDGWNDLFDVDDKHINVIPIDAGGLHPERSYRVALPKALRKPDQYYGHDLYGKGRHNLIIAKFTATKTLLGTLEVQK